MIFIFWTLSFKPAVSLSSFTFIKWLFNTSLLSAIRVVSSTYLRLLIFLPTRHAPSLITIQNQPYCTGIQNDPLGSRCCFCDEPLTRMTPGWVVYGASDHKGLVQVWVPGLARPARIGSWYVNDLPRFLDELGKWLLGWGWGAVFSSPLLNNKLSNSVVWLVVYQLGSVNGSAALPAVCWGWKVQDGDPTPEFGVSARLGNHWGCWLGLSVFMASLGFLTVSPPQSSLTWWLLPMGRKLPVPWKAGLGTDAQHHFLRLLLAKQVARPYLIEPEGPDWWAAASVHREEELIAVTFGDFYRTLGFLPHGLVETQALPLGRQVPVCITC